MCLGEFGTIVHTTHEGVAAVRFPDGSVREVSTAVLVAEGVTIAPGDSVLVSMGLAIRSVDPLGSDQQQVWS